MVKLKVAEIAKSVRTGFVKHSPEILTGIGIAGMITTTILAVRATPKAMTLLQNAKAVEEDLETHYVKIPELKPWDYVRVCWKPYIPAAVTGVLSIACLIGASATSVRRNAALAAAYTLSDTALREYREKVIETIGEKKERDIREKVAEDKIKKDPVSKNEVIITERGNTLCYDSISGRYFRSDIDRIKKAENKLNKQMLSDMYVSLNDFYDELDLDHTSVGYDLGWNLDDGLVEIDYTSRIADDGNPCLVINYRVAPKYNFSNFC